MPSDVTGDEVGAPTLCAFHQAVIRNLAEKDHVDDRDSDRAAASIARQCCARRTTP